jgi:hypothetical protein
MRFEVHFRQRIETAGAVFVELENGRVYFHDAPDKSILSLYAFACDGENIRLAIKSQRERMLVDQWESLV